MVRSNVSILRLFEIVQVRLTYQVEHGGFARVVGSIDPRRRAIEKTDDQLGISNGPVTVRIDVSRCGIENRDD